MQLHLKILHTSSSILGSQVKFMFLVLKSICVLCYFRYRFHNRRLTIIQLCLFKAVIEHNCYTLSTLTFDPQRFKWLEWSSTPHCQSASTAKKNKQHILPWEVLYRGAVWLSSAVWRRSTASTMHRYHSLSASQNNFTLFISNTNVITM